MLDSIISIDKPAIHLSDLISTLKKAMQAVKKGVAQSGSPTTPTQDGQGEKSCEVQVTAKKWL